MPRDKDASIAPLSSPQSSDDPVDLPESPHNMVASDIDFLMGNPHIDLAALTVFYKAIVSPVGVNPNSSVSNVTIRKKKKSGMRHSRGNLRTLSLHSDEQDNFTDIPIDIADDISDNFRALRACHPADVPQ